MSSKFRMSDSTLHRFVQIVQEAMLTGTDVSDHLRMVEMRPDATDPNVLVLTDEYVDMVRKQHESMLKFVAEQQAAQQVILGDEALNPGVIVGTGDSDTPKDFFVVTSNYDVKK